jgi:3-hydroxymyristoyl/3-hydroxydecanoyl-(acyl carrier protein) dehydratase
MNPFSVTLQIASDHPALAGHFPGSPIVPGVVLLDEALYAIEQAARERDPPSAWQIGAVKFHRVASPGEPLQLDVSWGADGLAHFQMRAASALIASGSVKRRPQIRAVVSA